jgi:hypothetical protein
MRERSRKNFCEYYISMALSRISDLNFAIFALPESRSSLFLNTNLLNIGQNCSPKWQLFPHILSRIPTGLSTEFINLFVSCWQDGKSASMQNEELRIKSLGSVFLIKNMDSRVRGKNRIWSFFALCAVIGTPCHSRERGNP